MDGGPMPICDGDLVLCEWDTPDPHQVAGKSVLLTGGVGDEVLALIKQPILDGAGWILRSSNPSFEDQPLMPDVKVIARVLEVVVERPGPTLWGFYDRDAIAGLFGHPNNPSWKVGHRDIEIKDQSHTVVMVNLRKPPGTPLEHHYQDRFLSTDELQWESQATTSPTSAKGQRIINQHEDGRIIHLFVRYHTKSADGSGEPYTYCGTLYYKKHEREKPMRVLFGLNNPLPQALWSAWSPV
jgi:hypothetical protein